MFSDIYHSFYYASLIISALTSILVIKKVDAPNYYIIILILATLVSESVAKYISFQLKGNSNIVYHVFVVVEYGLYCLIFSKLLIQLVFQRGLAASFVLLFFGEVINTVFFQPIRYSNTNMLIIEALLLVIWALCLFKHIREDISEEQVFKKPEFWFASAVLVYYSLNTLIWGFHSIKVYNLSHAPLIIYDINLLLSGILYLVFAITVLLNYFRMTRVANG